MISLCLTFVFQISTSSNSLSVLSSVLNADSWTQVILQSSLTCNIILNRVVNKPTALDVKYSLCCAYWLCISWLNNSFVKVGGKCPSLVCLICLIFVSFFRDYFSQPKVQVCKSEDEPQFQFSLNGIFVLNPAVVSIEKQLLLGCNEPSVWLDGAVILIFLLRSSEGERLLNLK